MRLSTPIGATALIKKHPPDEVQVGRDEFHVRAVVICPVCMSLQYTQPGDADVNADRIQEPLNADAAAAKRLAEAAVTPAKLRLQGQVRYY
jgi:hypothetical protein